jgi:hypothetical protein
MATIKIEPQYSPRLITVASPTTTITLQELVDLIRDWEVFPWNLTYPYIVTASGKQDLGGGTLVGITAQLQNAQLAFEARPIHVADGTNTALDTAGRLLTDAAATFVISGVLPGATVLNIDDLSIMTVIEVISDTQLLGTGLLDGALNQWAIGNHYKIWNPVSCRVTAGNLTAVDELGVSIDPIRHTAFTHISRETSTSAAMTQLTPSDVAPLAAAIWTSVLESGFTAEEVMRLMSAVLCGKTTISLGPPVTVTFRSVTDTRNRVVATMTGSTRTNVVFDKTL